MKKSTPIVLKTLNVATVEEAKRLLTNTSCQRLGLDGYTHWRFLTILEVIPNKFEKSKDRDLFNQEQAVKNACATLHISSNELEKRVKGYKKIPVSCLEEKYIRKFFNVPGNTSASRIARQDPKAKKTEKTIIQMWQDGKKYREIAKAINKNINITITKVNRIRSRQGDKILPLRNPGGYIPTPGYNPKNISKLMRDGKTTHDIAAMFNKPLHTVHSAIGRWRGRYPEYNIPYLIKPTPGFDYKNISKLIRAGKTSHDIAAMFKKPLKIVQQSLNRWRARNPEHNVPYFKPRSDVANKRII